MIQIFVFNTKIDPLETIADQKNALNSSKVFIANTINEVSEFGHYTGAVPLMDGYYNGGIVNGKIKFFAHSTLKNGF